MCRGPLDFSRSIVPEVRWYNTGEIGKILAVNALDYL